MSDHDPLLSDEALETTLLQQLGQGRRFLLGSSVVCGAVGLVPLPLVPDLAIDALRRIIITRLAKKREITASYATAGLVLGHDQNSPLSRLAATSAMAVTRRSWSRLTRSLLLFLRFEDMGRTYMLGTYFDYYLLRYHRGHTLSDEQAVLVGKAAAEAYSGAHLDILSALFRRTLSEAWRIGTAVPRVLWEMGTSLLAGQDEEMERVTEQQGGLVARGIALVEEQLEATGRATMTSLLHGFDQAWQRSGAQGQVVDRGGEA